MDTHVAPELEPAPNEDSTREKSKDVSTAAPGAAPSKHDKEVLQALTSANPYVPSWYHYNLAGSQLYYEKSSYVTTLEELLIKNYTEDILGFVKQMSQDSLNVLDIGAHLGLNNLLLIRLLLHGVKSIHYIPIEYNEDSLDICRETYQSKFSGDNVKITSCHDIQDAVKAVKETGNAPTLATIWGNQFAELSDEQQKFMLEDMKKDFGSQLALLISTDMTREKETLMKTFGSKNNKELNFHRNVLLRANATLPADFVPAKYDLQVSVDEDATNGKHFKVSSALVATEEATVTIGPDNETIKFNKDDKIQLHSGPHLYRTYTEQMMTSLTDSAHYLIHKHVWLQGSIAQGAECQYGLWILSPNDIQLQETT